jgi:transposase
MKKRKKYTSGFKTKVVLEALQERETIQELGRKYDLHPNQISTWKHQFLSSASTVFEKGKELRDEEKEKEKEALFKKVGQLQMEVDFLKKVLGK